MKRLVALWLCTCSSLLAQSSLSLEQISKDQGIWPAEVMVVVDHKVPVTENGKTRWRKLLPGKMYNLVSITAKEVTVDSNGTALTFKADETDLIARAEQIKALRDNPPAPTPVPPAAVPMDPPNSGPQMVAVGWTLDAQTSKPAATQTAAGKNVMARVLDGMLVRLNNGNLEPYDSSNLGKKKYVAVYFSASWCVPCRQFTPAFVDWYNRAKAVSDDFEVVFVSNDQDERSMKSYMQSDRMTWPAVTFAKTQNNPLLKYGGDNGIPCLVILNDSGSVVSHTYEGSQYLGPQKPLKDLATMLAERNN